MSFLSEIPFPKGGDLKQLLSLQNDHNLDELLFSVLEKPIQDLYSRPKKNIRGHLIEAGAAFLKQATGQQFETGILDKLSQILEITHTGSLIIDDIEDDSTVRRGSPALHKTYGLSVALNAGNWLYFLPFKIIQELNLSAENRQHLSADFHQTLFLAHYGQALDVGVSVDQLPQGQVYQTALASMELKSGVLTSFALKAPSLAAGNLELSKTIAPWGRQLGVALQMFDDIGNFSDKKNHAKKFEDLKLKRLCFVLAVTANSLSAAEYEDFWKRANSTEGSLETLKNYLDGRGILKKAQLEARNYLDGVLKNIEASCSSEVVLEKFKELQKILVGAYE